MNLSLQIMLNPASHDLSYNLTEAAARYRRGDIIGVHLTANVGTPNLNGRLGFIHITDVPDVVSFEKIKNILTSPVLNISADESFDPILDRRRQWRIPASALPIPLRNILLTDREITVAWLQAKPYIRKKIIIELLDSSMDDESTKLVDGDFD